MTESEPDRLSDDELAALRAHGVVLWAERLIFNAQPPMAPEQIAAVEAQCAGPIPEALAALWQLTAGGQLDYDLSVSMKGNQEAISWNELFFNGSSGYHDLQGWIDHERELADEAAAEDESASSALLGALPIGGFEYLDRIYVVVEPGAAQGRVLAWKHGLPPAWTHALHEDALSAIATDLRGAFAALHLAEDPLAPTDDYGTGQALLEWLDNRCEAHGLDRDLMDKAVGFYRRAIVDWRGPLADGSLRHDAGLARIALQHAIRTDDGDLVAELAAAGLGFDGALEGDAIATDSALGRGAFAAAAALVRAGAPVAPDALGNIDAAIAPELVTALIAEGGEPSVTAMVQCVACGAPASARLIGEACARAGTDVPAAFEVDRAALLAELEATLVRVHTDSFSHYLGAEGLAARIAHLRKFAL